MDGVENSPQLSRSLSPQDPELKDQLHILQEKEMILSQKLALEREKRMYAERISEMQRQACMELKLLLEKERKFAGRLAKGGDSNLLKELRKGLVASTEDSDDGSPKRSPSLHGQLMKEKEREDNVDVVKEGDEDKGETGPLLSLTSRDSLSHEVFSNLPEDLQEILRSSSFISVKPSKPNVEQALLDAVTCGDAPTLEKLIEAHGLGKTATKNNSSLIHIASARGYNDCLQVILEAGGDPNALGPAESTPIILAAAEGHHKCVRTLIGAGANVVHRDTEGYDALHRAILGGHEKCIQILLDSGIGSFAPNNAGQTILHAAVQSQSVACLRLVLTHLRAYHSEDTVSQLLNAQDCNGQSILHHAAGGSVKGCLQVLLPSPELDVELRDRWNRTAVDVATTDCRDLLINRDFREVVLCVASSQRGINRVQETNFAVGRIRLLKHHKWSDFDLLLAESLASYCKLLHGHPRMKGCGGSSVTKTPEMAKRDKGRKQPHEVVEELHKATSGLVLSAKPIASYHVGQLSWKPGELPRGNQIRTPFMLFSPKEKDGFSVSPEVVITLKDKQSGSLDDAAFSSLYSVGVLDSYLTLVTTYRNVIIHGPTGCGKSYLAKLLADCLKTQLDSPSASVTRASMHPGFRRDDLFRLLHYTGSLVPAGSGDSGNCSNLDVSDVPASPDSVSSQTTSASNGATGPHIIILDDIDRISIPDVLGELLGSIDKRGPQYPTWLGPTHSRDGSEETHPPSCYYLREDVYFIGTMNKNRSGILDQSTHNLFKHIWLTPEREPLSGLLLRHVNKKMISANRGSLPHRTSTQYLTAQWVCDVWCLINHYLSKMGLVEALLGPKHFLSCPVKIEGTSETIVSWLAELWNNQLAPFIRDNTYYLSATTGKERMEICTQVLTTLTQRAFRPTSPLDQQGLLKFLLTLDGGEEGLMLIAEARKRNKSGGKSPADSYLDLKEETSPFAMQRTFSAGSLPRHSVASTPQSTPGASRRGTLPGNSPDVPRQLHNASHSASRIDGASPTVKRNSLPIGTPPVSKRDLKQLEKRKKKGIGHVFRTKKSKLDESGGSSSSSLASTEDPPKQTQAPKDMDELISLVFSLGDRLEEQRSPLPTNRNSFPAFLGPSNGGYHVSPLARDSSTTPTPIRYEMSAPLPTSPQSTSTISTADSSGTSVCSTREGGGFSEDRNIMTGTGTPSPPRRRSRVDVPTRRVTAEVENI